MTIEDALTEEREEKMAIADGKSPVFRKGRFIKPCAYSPEKAASLPQMPLLSESISQKLTKWPSEVLFKGCKQPPKKWKQWVDRLAKKHEHTWKKACIYTAIMSSTCTIQIDREILLGLSEIWCSETNTFVFQWGEATVTLEDMFVLGGFPVLGKPITTPLIDGNLKKIEQKLIAEHKLFNRTKAKKVAHGPWMNRFMVSEDDELEHVAFLALWLSRFIFPSYPGEVIGKNVFSIAIHLSQGTRLALAPAILATIYKDLGFIYEQVYHKNSASVTVWAPFRFLLLWVWERFALLRPCDSPNLLQPGEPRMARWHKSTLKLRFKLKLPIIRSVLKQSDNFEWRPYVSAVSNCYYPPFYKEREELLNNGSVLEDDELQSFVRCLRCSELVGLDCIEQYLPNRVARQFGVDQDLPGKFLRVNSNPKIAWSSYDRHVKDPKFYIRCRFLEAECTWRYSKWWVDSMTVRREAIKNVLKKRERPKQNFKVKPLADKQQSILASYGFKVKPLADKEQSILASYGDHPPGFAPKKPNFKVNPQVGNSRIKEEEVKLNQNADKEQSILAGYGDHPSGFAPKKPIKLNLQERNSKIKEEEMSNCDGWGDHPPGFLPKKPNFSSGKRCDIGEDQKEDMHSKAPRKSSGSDKTQELCDDERKEIARTSKFCNSKELVLVEEESQNQKEEKLKDTIPIWSDDDYQFDEEYKDWKHKAKKRRGSVSVKIEEPENSQWKISQTSKDKDCKAQVLFEEEEEEEQSREDIPIWSDDDYNEEIDRKPIASLWKNRSGSIKTEETGNCKWKMSAQTSKIDNSKALMQVKEEEQPHGMVLVTIDDDDD